MTKLANWRSAALVLGAVTLCALLIMSLTPDISSAQKQLTCGLVGCDDGERDCAEITGILKIDVGPLEAGATVTYLCREP